MSTTPGAATANRSRGFIIILAVVVLALVAVNTVVFFVLQSSARAGERYGETTFNDLKPGACIHNFVIGETFLSTYTTVPCSWEHGAQLIYEPDLGAALDSYPGELASEKIATKVCDLAFENHLYLDSTVKKLYPSAAFEGLHLARRDWVAGDRHYKCFLFNTDGTALTGSFYVKELAGSE
jgi:hypothetical protein